MGPPSGIGDGVVKVASTAGRSQPGQRHVEIPAAHRNWAAPSRANTPARARHGPGESKAPRPGRGGKFGDDFGANEPRRALDAGVEAAAINRDLFRDHMDYQGRCGGARPSSTMGVATAAAQPGWPPGARRRASAQHVASAGIVP